MGRSIPSFRMLIDIERLKLRIFKENLSNKQDKESFNKLFTIPKLYCHSLSNLSQPIIMEPILLSILFQGFKEIDEVIDQSKKHTNNNANFNARLQRLTRYSQSEFPAVANDDQTWKKDYQYTRILEDWKKFSDCLSKEDESVFVKMIKSCYDNYYLSINSLNKNNENTRDRISGTCVTRTTSLFMALFLYQQKQLELFKTNQRLADSYD